MTMCASIWVNLNLNLKSPFRAQKAKRPILSGNGAHYYAVVCNETLIALFRLKTLKQQVELLGPVLG